MEVINIKEKQLFTIRTRKEARVFVLHNQLMQGSMLLRNEPKNSSFRQTVKNVRDDLRKELGSKEDMVFLREIATKKREQGRFETKQECVLPENQEDELPYWMYAGNKEAILV